MIFLTFLMSVPVTENEEVTVLARQPGAPYVFYKEAHEEEIAQATDADLEEADQVPSSNESSDTSLN